MSAPLISLSNGMQIPQIALGTGGTFDKEAIKYGIKIGFRHLDTAYIYRNEEQVGEAVKEAIAEGLVKREDLFITTKLPDSHHEIEKVVPTCKESLQKLGLDYVDSYLIHRPQAIRMLPDPNDSTKKIREIYEHDFVETWKGMEECLKLGLVRSIGVSNFSEQQLKRILDVAEIKPVVNQIKVDPLQNEKKLIEFCKNNGIQVTVYSALRSLNSPELAAHNSKLQSIAKNYNRTIAQVILRYIVESGAIPVTKSSNEERLKQSLDIFNDFQLTDEDFAFIDGLNIHESRAGLPPSLSMHGPRKQ